MKNGKVLYAWERGLKAFCFPASPNYVPKTKNPPVKEDPEMELNLGEI
jgi:hypothetical protein